MLVRVTNYICFDLRNSPEMEHRPYTVSDQEPETRKPRDLGQNQIWFIFVSCSRMEPIQRPRLRHFEEWNLKTYSTKSGVSIKCLPPEITESCRREGRKCMSLSWWRTAEEGCLNQLSKETMNSQKQRHQAQNWHRSASHFLCIY